MRLTIPDLASAYTAAGRQVSKKAADAAKVVEKNPVVENVFELSERILYLYSAAGMLYQQAYFLRNNPDQALDIQSQDNTNLIRLLRGQRLPDVWQTDHGDFHYFDELLPHILPKLPERIQAMVRQAATAEAA
ncbi:MAG TPA: hypothetical protein VFR09_00250 [Alphaproteobacteria bacterium]|nr:hypothetical protein [Alphaproteobacteria bacterium]